MEGKLSRKRHTKISSKLQLRVCVLRTFALHTTQLVALDRIDQNRQAPGSMRFYRLQTNHDMTPELCFEFCIGAGLDLFGLVGEECRCGASLLNKDVWQMAAPRTTGLLLPLAKQLPDTEMQCPVRVYRWIGPFVSGGSVPEHLQMLHHGSDMLRFRL